MKIETETGVEDIAAEEALQKLASGQATLSEAQDQPPFELLAFLNEKLDEPQDIWPSAVEFKVLGKLSEKLVRGGRRQSVVEEQQLEWLSQPEMYKQCRAIAFGDLSRHVDLYSAANATWTFHLKKRSKTEIFRHAAANEEIQKMGLFLPQKGNGNNTKIVQIEYLRNDNNSGARANKLWE